ncbi:MAG: SprB repeat-containing protein, partial [Bacteroidetes bacterium]|nr:SprB repeat-containing protein [Bacteroidota bacterium]
MAKLFFYSIFLPLAFVSSMAMGQEICDNGVDDDGDGDVDLNDIDCVCGGEVCGGELLSNPSFEDYNICPLKTANVNDDLVGYWNGIDKITPDYYNGGCNPAWVIDIAPQPLPDGTGYLGTIFAKTDSWMEQAGTCLACPMVGGATYNWSFQISTMTLTYDKDETLKFWDPTCTLDLDPIDLTLYGLLDNNTCYDPFEIDIMGLCPIGDPNGTWIVLGSVSMDIPNDATASPWTPQSVNFVVPAGQNITSVMFGGPCNVGNGYDFKWPCHPYGLWDDMSIQEVSGSPFNATVGVDGEGQPAIDAGTWVLPCSGPFQLEAIPDIDGCDFQWYKEGIALAGENGTGSTMNGGSNLLDVFGNGYGTGNYTFRVDCNAGVTSCTPYTVTTVVPTISFVSSTDPSCPGVCDGDITVSFTGGTAPYDLDWSTTTNVMGATSPSTESALCGTDTPFSVTVTDNGGCTDILSPIDLVEPTPIVIVVDNVVNESLCLQSDGAIDITVTGGTYIPPTIPVVETPSLSWDGPNSFTSTSEDLTGLEAGTYTVTATDDNGCIQTAEAVIICPNAVTCSIMVSSNYNGEDISCYGASDGEATVTVTGTNWPFNVDWSTSNSQGGLADLGSDIEPDLSVGTYTVTVTDDSGCVATLDVIIFGPNGFFSTIDTVINASCFGDCDGGAVVFAGGGFPPYTYSWDTLGGGTIPGATDSNITGL